MPSFIHLRTTCNRTRVSDIARNRASIADSRAVRRMTGNVAFFLTCSETTTIHSLYAGCRPSRNGYQHRALGRKCCAVVSRCIWQHTRTQIEQHDVIQGHCQTLGTAMVRRTRQGTDGYRTQLSIAENVHFALNLLRGTLLSDDIRSQAHARMLATSAQTRALGAFLVHFWSLTSSRPREVRNLQGFQ